MGGAGGSDEPIGQMLIEEFSESMEFQLGEGADWPRRWGLPFFELDMEIVWSMQS